ncbi:(d)CMP kinase [Natranaerofaba carboxydovora]|uniref:(d)CMP kinase n=1 Tax=Natranaerofaba carboxydovora TaxID=2742683 RepID=UPI001F14362C|nr:(d)CMP kinase [Natranaerofaba carboxydovora]UMZ73894.1 Cytidylate kinase [Natranaerofaba carboxydovora]
MQTGFIVAIDGPAGAGKSTVAKMSAFRLKFNYLDTGAMYRALAWFALQKNINLEDSDSLKELINDFDIDIKTDSKGNSELFLDGKDITEEVRRPEISQAVSYVANDISVRYYMVDKQRELAKGKECILEGRDIGTYVFPDADMKIFLTASIEERAKRRLNELKEKGYEIEFGDLKKEIEDRDNKDKNREVGALKKAKDAVEVDTTDLSLNEVVNKIVDIVNQRYKEKVQGG